MSYFIDYGLSVKVADNAQRLDAAHTNPLNKYNKIRQRCIKPMLPDAAVSGCLFRQFVHIVD